jgi:hypothetical protein
VVIFTVIGASAASAQDENPILDIPVTGTITSDDGDCGTFAGQLDIKRFQLRKGVIYAVARLTGTITDASGRTRRIGNRLVRLPVIGMSTSDPALRGDCPILNLVLGPLDLNLLGLKVHLDQVVLDITADAGGGNLLGNLLCAIAGLLDPLGALQQIVALLNEIVDILSGIGG